MSKMKENVKSSLKCVSEIMNILSTYYLFETLFFFFYSLANILRIWVFNSSIRNSLPKKWSSHLFRFDLTLQTLSTI